MDQKSVQRGPILYILAGAKQSFKGIGQLFKHPKILLPVLIMVVLWVVLSYWKLANPNNEFVMILSFFTFAQGGMYGGYLGAIGGILGKGFMAWVVTRIFMPKSMKEQVKKTAEIKRTKKEKNGLKVLGLFITGVGLAFIVYRFISGNASVENSMFGIIACITSIKAKSNEDGFMNGWIRSFSKGKMSKKLARKLIGGMTFGFVCSIVMSFLSIASLLYSTGFILLLIGLTISIFTSSKKTITGVIAVLIMFTIIFPLTSFAGAKDVNDWEDIYDAYEISNYDFDELTTKVAEKPFTGIAIQPIGVILGLSIAEIKGAPIYYIDKDESVMINIDAAAPSIEDLYNQTDDYSLWSASIQSSVKIEFDQAGYSMELYDEIDNKDQKLAIVADSIAAYKGSYNNRSEYADGVANSTFITGQSKERHPAYFDSYESLYSAYFEAEESNGLYSSNLVHQQFEKIYLMVELSKGEGMLWNDGEEDEGVYGELICEVIAVSMNESPKRSQNFESVWVLDEIEYVQHLDDDAHFPTEVSDGRIYIYSGEYAIDSFDVAYELLWSDVPKEIPLGKEDEIEIIEKLTCIRNSGQNSGVGTFSTALYIEKFTDETRENKEVVYRAYFMDRSDIVPADLWPELNAGESIEKRLYVDQMPVATGETDYSRLNSDNSRLVLDFGEIRYYYQLTQKEVITDIKEKDKEDNDASSVFGDDYDPSDYEDFAEHANEEDTGLINIVSIFGAVIGAGVALAGGFSRFGGSGGPNDGDDYSKYGEYDPSDQSLIVTGPRGNQEIYIKNEESDQFEDNYGNILNLGDISRAHNEQAEAMKWSENQRDLMELGQDGDTEHWHKISRVQHLKERLEKASKGDPNSLKTHMAKRLEKIQTEVRSGKEFDDEGYKKVQRAIGRYTLGEIADKDDIPPSYTDFQEFKDGLNLSAEELARGSSKKAIAVRVLAGFITGGKSEYVFESAKSIYTTKDYVDAGGNSLSGAISKSAANVIIDEGIGRGIGAGLGLSIKAVGKVGSFGAKILNKTQMGKKITTIVGKTVDSTVDFFGTDVKVLAKRIINSSKGGEDDVGRALKNSNALKAFKGSKELVNQGDDLAKNVANQVDDAAKTGMNQVDDTMNHISKDADDATKAAKDEIKKYRELASRKGTSQRDLLHQRGERLGAEKVDSLRKAELELNTNNTPETRDAYDEALRKVQQDKYAMNKLKADEGQVVDEVRKGFNQRNDQFNQAALKNTRERLAKEHGVPVDEIKFVEASNSSEMSKVADASRTAKQVDKVKHTSPDYEGTASVDDMAKRPADIKSAPMDKDVSGRIYDKKAKEWIDIPKEDVERIYRQELYKTHHKGKLPKTTLDGKEVFDDAAIRDFADNMDHTVTDRLGKDAYGTGDKDLITILDKSGKLKSFDDVSSVTGTMEYKTNEWLHKADNLRKAASESKGNEAIRLLTNAESIEGEGIRQLTKQFKNQTTSQVKAAIVAGKNVKIPPKLFKAMKVLEQVGKPPKGITVYEAEEILKSMNTSLEDVIRQNSSIMEMITKFEG